MPFLSLKFEILTKTEMKRKAYRTEILDTAGLVYIRTLTETMIAHTRLVQVQTGQNSSMENSHPLQRSYLQLILSEKLKISFLQLSVTWYIHYTPG